MMHIQRDITEEIVKKLQPNKVVIVYGAREAGKTVLVRSVFQLLNRGLIKIAFPLEPGMNAISSL